MGLLEQDDNFERWAMKVRALHWNEIDLLEVGNEVWTRKTTKDTKKGKQTDSPLKLGKDKMRKRNIKNALKVPAYMTGRVNI